MNKFDTMLMIKMTEGEKPKPIDKSPQQNALQYATVREQRRAIETAIRLLNEVGTQTSTAMIKASDHLMAIRNLLDDKDSQLFEEEQDLYFKLKS